MSALKVIVLSPASSAGTFRAPVLAIAAARGGAIGVADVEFGEGTGHAAAAYEKLLRHSQGGAIGLRGRSGHLGQLMEAIGAQKSQEADSERHIVLTAGLASFDQKTLSDDIAALHNLGFICIVETIDLGEARLAQSCGADCVIAKGHEGAGPCRRRHHFCPGPAIYA